MSRPQGRKAKDYDAKRRDLLKSMTDGLLVRNGRQLSLRDLSAAAGVSIPTLRHYFGARHDIIAAIFEERLRLGRRGLDAQAQSALPFADSVQEYARALVDALDESKEQRLGDLFAVSLAEGFLDKRLGPATLRHIIDPTINALEERLKAHIALGEMEADDPRGAALMLLSPILLASLHQTQLHGSQSNPMALTALADNISRAFVRAFRSGSLR